MIPQLTRLFFSSVRTGAVWVTDAFVRECEAVVRAGVRMIISFAIALVLIRASVAWDSPILMAIGVFVGAIGGLYFLVRSSPSRFVLRLASRFSIEAQKEINNFSSMVFIVVVVLFYLMMEQAQRQPKILYALLGLLFMFFVGIVLPGETQSMLSFKKWFRFLLSACVISLMALTVLPESVADRVFSSHWLEQRTGTIAIEIPFLVDSQDRIIDSSTGQPMEFFERVYSKGEQPKALKGWTLDERGNYHLYKWFDKQGNANELGDEIQPITRAKIKDIVSLAKQAAARKLAEEKKTADEQKAKSDAEAVQQKAKEDEEAKKYEEKEKIINDMVAVQRQEQEKVNAAAREQLYNPVLVPAVLLPPIDSWNLDSMIYAKPGIPFMFDKSAVEPDKSFIVLKVVKVDNAPEKGKYLLTIQPWTVITENGHHDITSFTSRIELTVSKEQADITRRIMPTRNPSPNSKLSGVIFDAVSGGIYTVVSRGKRFQLITGTSIPPIKFKPILQRK
ncbi:MAG: hypothetical protein KBC81_02465 [Candidatus Pacebacteria bacterium]|nr:hypothetical protein [Candidatus Paceibacterota bacterium]